MYSPASSSQRHPVPSPLSATPISPQRARQQSEESNGQEGFRCPGGYDESLRSNLARDVPQASRTRRRAHTAVYPRGHQPARRTSQAVSPISSHSGRQPAGKSPLAWPDPGPIWRSSAPARTANAQLQGDQSRTHSAGRPLQARQPRYAALLRPNGDEATVRSDRRSGLGGEGSNAPLRMTPAQWAAAKSRGARQQGPQIRKRCIHQHLRPHPGGKAQLSQAGRKHRKRPTPGSAAEIESGTQASGGPQGKSNVQSAAPAGEIYRLGPKPGRASQAGEGILGAFRPIFMKNDVKLR
ncbi:hypothetical protein NDU88_000686 [Pleurodeles waltl]|uniref:Uncharacterized protein n=1 Tax=Pleurodeles waltl TaxID=8319 RepID=A0AAV7VWX9_PLEWA|nr:hypothetical protein NDU88_000686 [Pleurodeles waltl]